MRIGQLAEATGTTTKTLRFYEESGLLPPAERMASGYRDYTDDAVGQVGFIHRGQAAGLTLAQIGQILRIREHGQAPCSHVRDLLGERLRELDAQIAELLALRETISELHAQAAEPEPDTCSADEVCRYI
ncbi:heavy metal-responsive transcriptional regulator [Pseudarthrobacter sp. RMG13]|uniref:Heavy metal-responsive transcriptional regulator n=1 Tax=Pseudarthrobacter humi TaxID=2952523 RepID=A0ABT1LTR7_9MICC|nr:heavy metal-responsive transcriptional regulator [Pseudarthrobacter humi]MCP9001869.1 heavy metal-responsive transcriptional regulator [Pseudarthrobacter humi]